MATIMRVMVSLVFTRACFEFLTTLTFRLHGNHIVSTPFQTIVKNEKNLEYGKARRITLTLKEHGNRMMLTPFQTIVKKKKQDTETVKTRRPHAHLDIPS